ncbi:MAG: Periplasmic thiol:disulfide interchange protein DsbA [Proteobacteria bacterium]|nr:Periplasmic thiol:disulfide interchange protein DsbA [Acidobacteriota bacterium]MBS1212945.1 Periplasmic thiol:disulfide interchange protein DsbA [Pseudomonadota bacterium]
MHERLFQNQKALEPGSAHANALGLDVARFEGCMAAGKHADAVRSGISTAGKAGVSATPSFMIAVTHPTDPAKVIGLTLIRGAQPFASFKSVIDNALAFAEKR